MSNKDLIKVLVVDDIAETRENIRKLLQFESDFEIVGAARNGQEGIDLAKELQPDVILMDINMPDIDGITSYRNNPRTGSALANRDLDGTDRSRLHAPCHAGRGA